MPLLPLVYFVVVSHRGGGVLSCRCGGLVALPQPQDPGSIKNNYISQTPPRTQGKQATASQQARRPFLFFSFLSVLLAGPEILIGLWPMMNASRFGLPNSATQPERAASEA
jgi:hypothetical protein